MWQEMKRPKKQVWQRHHMHYPGEEEGERTVKIRKGIHACITILRRFKMITMDEAEAIHYECMRKLDVNNDINLYKEQKQKNKKEE